MKIGLKQLKTFVRIARSGGLRRAVAHSKMFFGERKKDSKEKELDKKFRERYKSRRLSREGERKVNGQQAAREFDQFRVEYEGGEMPILQQQPLVSIIVLTLNGIEHLRRLTESIQLNTLYANYELIIIDNGSTDGSIEFLKENQHKLPIRLVENKENTSFSGGCNQGAALAKGELLLFLNNDIQPLRGWLTKLVNSYHKNENVGSIGGRLIYPEKENFDLAYSIQHAGIKFEYDPFEQFYRPYNYGKGESIHDHGDIRDFPAVTAALVLVSRDVFDEVGGFDERYFYGYEDVDLGLKIHKAGYRNIYDPGVAALHYEFGTQAKDVPDEVAERRRKNINTFKEKWHVYLTRLTICEQLKGKNFFAEQDISYATYFKKPDLDRSIFPSTWNYLSDHKANESYFAADHILIFTDDIDFEYSQCNRYSPSVRLIYMGNIDAVKLEEMFKFQKFDVVCIEGGDSEKINHVQSYCTSINLDKGQSDLGQELSEVFSHVSIGMKLPIPDWAEATKWGDYHFALAFKKYLLREGFLVRFHNKPDHYIDEWNYDAITFTLRGLTSYTPNAWQENYIWVISHPENVSADEYNLYDRVFVASHSLARILEESIDVPVEAFLQCSDHEFFVPPSEDEKINELEGEVIFIGSTRDLYRDAVKFSIDAEIPIKVYGPGWRKFIDEKYIVDDFVENSDLYRYYGSAAVVLNDHWEDMREQGIVSNRVFDVLSCGGVLVSDSVCDMPEELRQYIYTYRDSSGFAIAVENARSAATTQREKQQIRELIKEKYSFESRAKRIRKLAQI